MQPTDFTVEIGHHGYVLRYKGYFLGGGIENRGGIRKKASDEIRDILCGKGFSGYLAIINFIENKRRENAQCTFF